MFIPRECWGDMHIGDLEFEFNGRFSLNPLKLVGERPDLDSVREFDERTSFTFEMARSYVNRIEYDPKHGIPVLPSFSLVVKAFIENDPMLPDYEFWLYDSMLPYQCGDEPMENPMFIHPMDDRIRRKMGFVGFDNPFIVPRLTWCCGEIEVRDDEYECGCVMAMVGEEVQFEVYSRWI